MPIYIRLIEVNISLNYYIMKIITSVVNNPLFIEIQYYTLQKYFQGEYEFIVFKLLYVIIIKFNFFIKNT